MKTIYYVDIENVSTAFISILGSKISRRSTLAIFYSDENMKFNFMNLSQLELRGVNVKFIKCFTGRNALDFQLISTIGYSIAKLGTNCRYIIISNDTGYDSAVKYWRQFGYNVEREVVESAINVDATLKEDEKGKSDVSRTLLFQELIHSGLSNEQAVLVCNIAKTYSRERMELKMNHIRSDIFSKYKYDEAEYVWKSCHKILKETDWFRL